MFARHNYPCYGLLIFIHATLHGLLHNKPRKTYAQLLYEKGSFDENYSVAEQLTINYIPFFIRHFIQQLFIFTYLLIFLGINP